MTRSLGSTFAALVVLGSSACHAEAPPKAATDDAPAASSSASVGSIAVPTTSPTLTYQEEAGTFSYWANGAVRIVVTTPTGMRTCDGELGEHGNIWTRADLEAALHHADVEAALADAALYRSAYPTRALLSVGPKSTITWVNAWKELPPPEPAAVHHLHEVLHVLWANRISLCP